MAPDEKALRADLAKAPFRAGVAGGALAVDRHRLTLCLRRGDG
jgi:hypothetical protein